MNSRSSIPNNRNQQRRPNNSYRRNANSKAYTDKGMLNFQNTLTQLNQINQMMIEGKKGNPMDMFNQFFNNQLK